MDFKIIGIIPSYHKPDDEFEKLEMCSFSDQVTGAILELFSAGKVFAVTLQVVEDVVDGEIIGPIEYKTVDSFIWPTYMEHYFKKYDYCLPDNFVDLAKEYCATTELITNTRLASEYLRAYLSKI